jgi:hemerythrin-like domain-containing protein
MKITEALVAEHVVYHNLFDHIEKTLPKLKTLAEIYLLAALLEAMLRTHSQAEDKLILEPLDHYLDQIGQSDTFHKEHEEIDASLILAQQAREVRKARQLLLRAVIFSRKHFAKEERIVFPLAEQVLKNKTLFDLGKAWQDQRKHMQP